MRRTGRWILFFPSGIYFNCLATLLLLQTNLYYICAFKGCLVKCLFLSEGRKTYLKHKTFSYYYPRSFGSAHAGLYGRNYSARPYLWNLPQRRGVRSEARRRCINGGAASFRMPLSNSLHPNIWNGVGLSRMAGHVFINCIYFLRAKKISSELIMWR